MSFPSIQTNDINGEHDMKLVKTYRHTGTQSHTTRFGCLVIRRYHFLQLVIFGKKRMTIKLWPVSDRCDRLARLHRLNRIKYWGNTTGWGMKVELLMGRDYNQSWRNFSYPFEREGPR